MPELRREGFSLAAALFGALWLLAWGAWIPAALVFAANIAATLLAARWHNPAPQLACLLAQGCFGRDLLRWHLALRGYQPGPAVVAASRDAALLRLITECPELQRP